MSGTKDNENDKPNGQDKDEQVLQPVGDGAEDLESGEREGSRAEKDDEDRRARGDNQEDEDRRAGGNREDEEDERGRDPRDLTQREKRDRRRRARDRDRTELRYLRHRNEQLELSASETAKRLDRLEESRVEDKLSRIRGALRNADSTIIRLAAAGEEAQAVEAQTLKGNLEQQLREEEKKLNELRSSKDERGGDADDPAAAAASRRRELPQEVRSNVEDWKDRNPWFDAANPDTNSRIAMALDQDVLADGYDPKDPEYYRELDRRIADYLPKLARRGKRDYDDERDEHRRGAREDDDREYGRRGKDRDDDGGRERDEDRRGGRREARGPVFRVGGRDRPLKENEVYLSKERRKALEEMGAMDDPVLRNKYLKAFKKYDEANARRDR